MPAGVSPVTVGRVVLGFFAAWLAMGSTGVLASSLEMTAAVLLVFVAAVTLPPRLDLRQWAGGILIVALLLALPLCTTPDVSFLPLIVVAVMSLAAAGESGVSRRALQIGAMSVLALVLFRLAQQAIPLVWLLSNEIGSGLGRIAGVGLNRSLEIGPTLGGLDFLVVMGVFYAGWGISIQPPRGVPMVCAGIAILLGHFAYLLAVAGTPDIVRMLPIPVVPPPVNPYVPPPLSWPSLWLQMLPWNLPLLAAAIHGAVAAAMMRWAAWKPCTSDEPAAPVAGSPVRTAPGTDARSRPVRLVAANGRIAAKCRQPIGWKEDCGQCAGTA